MAHAKTLKISILLMVSVAMMALSAQQAKADVRINIGFGYPTHYYSSHLGGYVFHHHHRPIVRHHYYAPPWQYNKSYRSYAPPRPNYHALRHNKYNGHSRGHRHNGHRYYR